LENPAKMKINEPKTPYCFYEGDDDYLQQLNEINKAQATEEILLEVQKRMIDNIEDFEKRDDESEEIDEESEEAKLESR